MDDHKNDSCYESVSYYIVSNEIVKPIIYDELDLYSEGLQPQKLRENMAF
jgi:hypothetical protein